MDSNNSYLSRLKFDPKLLGTFKAKYLTNIRIVILLVIIIVVSGVTSFLTLPRRLNPEVKIPIVGVTTILPGASPKDVEELVTNPIEDAVKGVKGISQLSSSSNESASTVVAQFNSNINPDKAEADMKSAIDKVNNLPENAQTPNVRKFDFEDQPVWIFAVKSNDPASLYRFSKLLKNKIEDNTQVDRVTLSGLEEQEIQILADPVKVANFGLNPITLSSSVKSLLSSYPAGSLNTETLSYPFSVQQFITSVDTLRNTVITVPSGGQIRLSDVATISESVKPDTTHSFIATSKKTAQTAVTFYVYKTSTATIDEAVSSIRSVVEKTVKPYKSTFEIVSVTDTSDLINQQFGDLTSSFRDTLILVFITFLIFLGIRQALIAVLTIPLTFLVSFTVIKSTGLSLNFLSLFSLLLALGLLVDDTIVVVTGMTSYYRTKKFTPEQTGLLVWRDLIVPIWSTTITTSWAFLPLLLSTGIIGEFIKTIPIVVATTLYSSTAIAVLITIPLMIVILRLRLPRRVMVLLLLAGALLLTILLSSALIGNPLLPLILIFFFILLLLGYRSRKVLATEAIRRFGKKNLLRTRFYLTRLNERLVDIEHIAEYYKKIIRRILVSKGARRKVIFAVIIFIVFSFLLLPFGFVTNEFFPKSENDYFYVNLKLPSGTNSTATTQEALQILSTLRKVRGIDYISLEIGRGIQAGSQDMASGSNLALFTIDLPPKKTRSINSIDIAQNVRKLFARQTYAQNVTVVEESGGPPAGADVQVQLLGDDFSTLDEYADKVMHYLQEQPGVINVTKSVNPGTAQLTFVPDLQKIADAGLTLDQIGLWTRTFASGFTVKSVKFGERDTQDIVFRLNDAIHSPEDLGNLYIPTQQGAYLPLLSLGTLTLETNPATITHLDTKRAISVSAGVEKSYSVSLANKNLLSYVDRLNLPEGYSYKTGGANEENQKSVNSILQSMLIAGMLILATMVIQFRSYRKALIVMFVIPIAISGVFVVFALTGTPLSFPALIGVLSLFGIVVTHAMFLVDKFNRNLSFGMPFVEAIADGAASRLEPVFIGSFTTIVGLIPISLSNPLWRGLGGAIIAGLTFSGLIMLFFIPVIFYLIYHKATPTPKA